MVPMTFISFIAVRPVGPAGLAVMEVCTTVSTFALAITLVISGLRMSARTNSARPILRRRSRGGGTVSTPSTRSMAGLAASRAARWPPRKQLAVLLLRHALAALLDDRAHAGSLAVDDVVLVCPGPAAAKIAAWRQARTAFHVTCMPGPGWHQHQPGGQEPSLSPRRSTRSP